MSAIELLVQASMAMTSTTGGTAINNRTEKSNYYGASF
jgi:hypothetical protein